MINWLQYVIIPIRIFHNCTGLKKCLKTGKDTRIYDWTQPVCEWKIRQMDNLHFSHPLAIVSVSLWIIDAYPSNEWKQDVENTNKNEIFFIPLFFAPKLLPLINSPPKKQRRNKVKLLLLTPNFRTLQVRRGGLSSFSSW